MLDSSVLSLEGDLSAARAFSHSSPSCFPGAGLAHAHREAASRQWAQTPERHSGHWGVTAGSEGQICRQREVGRAGASSPSWDGQQDPVFTPYRTNEMSAVGTCSEGLHDSRRLVFGQTSSELITSDLLTVSSSMAWCKCPHCCWKVSRESF